MNEQTLIDLLVNNVSLQLRHKHFDRTVDIAEDCYMVTAGKGARYEEQVKRYRRFEKEALKEQRVRLNNPLTPLQISRNEQIFRKLYRVDNVRREVSGLSDVDKEAMQTYFWNFMPGKDLETWAIEKVVYLNKTDPNAFILFDRYDRRRDDGEIEQTTLNPVIYRSPDVLNFQRDAGGVLLWVLFREIRFETVIEGGASRRKMLEDFFLYDSRFVIRAREAGEKTEMLSGEVVTDIPVFPVGETAETPITYPPANAKSEPFPSSGANVRRFCVSAIEHGAGEVPAICVGAFPDEESAHGASVSWYWPGMPVLKNIIRDSQMLDVAIVMQAYRRRWEFAPPCEYETEDGHHCGDERKGYVKIGQTFHTCPACHGAGTRPSFSTEQEVNRVPLPQGADDQIKMLELTKLSFEEPIDTSLLGWFTQSLEKHEVAFDTAIFGTGQMTKPTGTELKTATEVLEKSQSLADVLRPVCLVISQVYELAWRVLFNYREYSGELKVNHSYPENIDLLTMQQELANFQTMREVGIYEATSIQRHRILAKLFEGEPETHRKIAARDEFIPFADKSPEQVAQIVAMRSPLDRDVVLWANFVPIFQEIETADSEFYKKPFEARKKVVDAKVEEFKGRIMLAGSNEMELPDFNTDEEETPESNE